MKPLVCLRLVLAVLLVAAVICAAPGTVLGPGAPLFRNPVSVSRGEDRYAEVVMLVTAYTAGPESTGKRPGHPSYGVTASGERVARGVVAADPRVPFGTRVWVPGYGFGVVLDRGGAVKGARLDVYVESVEEARSWGVRMLPIRFWGFDPAVLLGGDSE